MNDDNEEVTLEQIWQGMEQIAAILGIIAGKLGISGQDLEELEKLIDSKEASA